MKRLFSTIAFMSLLTMSNAAFAQQTTTYCWQGNTCQQVFWAGCMTQDGQWNPYCTAISHRPVPFNLCTNTGAPQC